jgi:uncharacterized protein
VRGRVPLMASTGASTVPPLAPCENAGTNKKFERIGPRTCAPLEGGRSSYRAPIEWRSIGRSTEFPELPRSIYWLANVFFYGFGEEVGWRGFALPRLQSHTSALRASLLLAVGWAGWHIPLFAFSSGLSNLGVAGAGGWFMSVVLGSILLTWLFNSSGGSIGAVALFHAALDIFISSPVAAPLPNVMGALLTVGTLLLILISGRRDLSWRSRITEPACT